MTKSRFMNKQQPVTIIEKDKMYVYICINEKEVVEEAQIGDSLSSTPVTLYEYDYNEIIEDIGILDVEDIKNNPEKYINYKKDTRTDKERIEELEAMNNELSATLDNLLTDIIPSLMSDK